MKFSNFFVLALLIFFADMIARLPEDSYMYTTNKEHDV